MNPDLDGIYAGIKKLFFRYKDEILEQKGYEEKKFRKCPSAS